uniref:Uncharacterized protein n=1 Tax=Rhizophora mucronata TaxID=61149 RepID=A0A2P2QXS4_RHIMU
MYPSSKLAAGILILWLNNFNVNLIEM